MPRTPYENAKRGKATGPTRDDPKKKSFRKRSADAPTFDRCNPLLLSAIVCLCTTYNASPTFSYTRDGTSLVVAVYFDGERYVDYLADCSELRDWFLWMCEDLLTVNEADLKPYALIAPETV